MKKICLEKQLNLLEKLIVLSLTGFGAQAWGWLLRDLDGGNQSGPETVLRWICLGGNLYFFACLLFGFLVVLKRLNKID